MSRFIKDKDGDHIEVGAEDDGVTEGVTISATMSVRIDGETTTHRATVGPIDPHELIAEIHAEMGWDRPKEEPRDCPGELVQEVADRINSGETTLSFEEAIGRRSNLRTLDEEIDARAAKEEDPEKVRGAYVHTTPATAEEPRVWAGADEPIIDQLIGSVADARAKADAAYMVADSALREASESQEQVEAHQHLAEHWERRMDVVQRALTMIPAPGKRGGIAAAFSGEEIEQVDRVEKALKIARFAADEDRDIPGVDR